MQRWDSQDSEVVDQRAESECFVHGLSTEGWGEGQNSRSIVQFAMFKDQEIL